MSGNPTTPSNVVPMPTNWPGPMFTPKTFPPGGPSCFSELAGLNACYDSIQMMNQILAKVITDLVTNDKAVQAAIVAAIAASGSNVPLIGVTNGSDAQPGQVGEYVQFYPTVTYPATTFNTQIVVLGTLQPGDWECQLGFWGEGFTGGTQFQLDPVQAGFTTNMQGATTIGGVLIGSVGMAIPARASLSAPTLVSCLVETNTTNDASATSTTGHLFFSARRAR